jgi:arylsulfatase A-like enzyme
MTQPPNILILMIDQQKASALRLDKAIGIPAPTIERLAARGVRYEGCYAPRCGLFIHPWPSQMDKEPAQRSQT